jgi:hypothetical protein
VAFAVALAALVAEIVAWQTARGRGQQAAAARRAAIDATELVLEPPGRRTAGPGSGGGWSERRQRVTHLHIDDTVTAQRAYRRVLIRHPNGRRSPEQRRDPRSTAVSATDALTHRYAEAPQLLRVRLLILLSSTLIWSLRRWTCTEIRRPWLR